MKLANRTGMPPHIIGARDRVGFNNRKLPIAVRDRDDDNTLWKAVSADLRNCHVREKHGELCYSLLCKAIRLRVLSRWKSSIGWKSETAGEFKVESEDWVCARERERSSFSRTWQDVSLVVGASNDSFCLGFLLGTTFWPQKCFPPNEENTHKPNEHTTNGWYTSQFSLSRSLTYPPHISPIPQPPFIQPPHRE